jgi:dephospho-CoA kinase
VFGDEAARRRLEGIIHPRVQGRTRELAAAAPPDAVVVNDVPLLMESGLAPTYNLVVVVWADEAVRVDRLERLRGITAAEARRRIRAQASDAQRAAAADVMLRNDGTLDELAEQVRALWTGRLVPYEENVRLRRCVWPERALLVPYDPSWPEQYARLTARIGHAAGPAARSLDHIGPTAVPGLPARDVVDIQLGVADLSTADAVADALRAAGLPRAEGERVDEPRPAGGGQPRDERLHGSADPARPVNLHVRVAGSPPWRYALLMRDFLRADEVSRAGYARAAQAADERRWFDETVPRMEDWARRTGWTP